MKKGGEFSNKKEEIETINHLLRALERHIEKMERAYNRKDHEEFNMLRKQVVQLQKKIHEVIE